MLANYFPYNFSNFQQFYLCGFAGNPTISCLALVHVLPNLLTTFWLYILNKFSVTFVRAIGHTLSSTINFYNFFFFKKSFILFQILQTFFTFLVNTKFTRTLFITILELLILGLYIPKKVKAVQQIYYCLKKTNLQFYKNKQNLNLHNAYSFESNHDLLTDVAYIQIIPTPKISHKFYFKRFIFFLFMQLVTMPYIGKISRLLFIRDKFFSPEVILELYFFLGIRLDILEQNNFFQQLR